MGKKDAYRKKVEVAIEEEIEDPYWHKEITLEWVKGCGISFKSFLDIVKKVAEKYKVEMIDVKLKWFIEVSNEEIEEVEDEEPPEEIKKKDNGYFYA